MRLFQWFEEQKLSAAVQADNTRKAFWSKDDSAEQESNKWPSDKKTTQQPEEPLPWYVVCVLKFIKP